MNDIGKIDGKNVTILFDGKPLNCWVEETLIQNVCDAAELHDGLDISLDVELDQDQKLFLSRMANMYDCGYHIPHNLINPSVDDYCHRNNGHPFAAMYGGTPKRNKSK